ncbi:MAG: Crp/Fnr family transcriptional regulator [Hyphomicrobium sp.]
MIELQALDRSSTTREHFETDRPATRPAEALTPPASVKTQTIARDEHLFREGQAKTRLYRVDSGALCITSRHANGVPEIVELALPGDVLGLGFLDHHITSASAVVETTVSVWSLDALPGLCESVPGTAERHADATEREFAHRRRELVGANEHRPMHRVAAFLAAVSRLNQIEGRDPRVITDRLRSADVADFLRLDVATLAGSLMELQNRGLISPEASGSLRLSDPLELERLATVSLS